MTAPQPLTLSLRPGPNKTRYLVRSAWVGTIGERVGRTRQQQLLGLRVAAHGEQLLHLITQGWYRKDQVNLLMGRAARTRTYHYQLIPPGIMRQLATNYGMAFTAATLPPEVNLTLPADLRPASAALLAGRH